MSDEQERECPHCWIYQELVQAVQEGDMAADDAIKHVFDVLVDLVAGCHGERDRAELTAMIIHALPGMVERTRQEWVEAGLVRPDAMTSQAVN